MSPSAPLSAVPEVSVTRAIDKSKIWGGRELCPSFAKSVGENWMTAEKFSGTSVLGKTPRVEKLDPASCGAICAYSPQPPEHSV